MAKPKLAWSHQPLKPVRLHGENARSSPGAGPGGHPSPDTSPPPSGLPRADLMARWGWWSVASKRQRDSHGRGTTNPFVLQCSSYWKGCSREEDEAIAEELFFGRTIRDKSGKAKKEYPVQDSKRERSAKEALIRLLTYDCGIAGNEILGLARRDAGGELFVYVARGSVALNSVADLLGRWRRHPKRQAGLIPVIRLENGTYPSKKFGGFKPKPLLSITDWVTKDGNPPPPPPSLSTEMNDSLDF